MAKRSPIIKVAGEEESSRVMVVEEGSNPRPQALTQNERAARKIAMTAGGWGSSKNANFYGTGDVSMGTGGNWYSPQLSTDFLEKPQNLRERRAWYRHFYNSTEIIGAAIDLHSTIPLSKVRLQKPKCKNAHLAEYSYRFFSRMVDRLDILKVLSEISHEYFLIGNVFIYSEDHNPYEGLSGSAKDALVAKGKAQSDMLLKNYKVVDKDPNYIGWSKIVILPPDQVKVERVPFSDNPILSYAPDEKTKEAIIARSRTGGEQASNIPEHIAEAVQSGGNIELDQDPDKGSFALHMARKKSQYEEMGVSILERCVNTLLVKDKLRQAQTSIASRHMTPTRVITGEDLSDSDVEDLRMQVDMALMDPDYSIVANYAISWEEYGSNQRLLDLSAEFERYDSDLYAGLGVTKEMMTGEASYSGSKITLELLNIQYLQFRDMLQNFVEKKLFAPVALRKGFVETDDYGNPEIIYPKVSFARLSIRDNDSVFDQLMQLYNKGSVPIEDIYDLIGIDANTAQAKLVKDLFSVNDAAFNDLLRGAYQAASQELPSRTDLLEKIAGNMGLNVSMPSEDSESQGGSGGLRFASRKASTSNYLDVQTALRDDPDAMEEVLALLEKRRVKVKVGGK